MPVPRPPLRCGIIGTGGIAHAHAHALTEPGVSLAEARRTLEFAAATYSLAFQGRSVSAGEIAGSDPFNRSMDGGVVPWAPIKETFA